MKQAQAREYIKPRIETYRSREVVEALGNAEAALTSGKLADDNC